MNSAYQNLVSCGLRIFIFDKKLEKKWVWR